MKNGIERLAAYWGKSPKDLMDQAQDAGLISDNAVEPQDVWPEDAERAARTLYKRGRPE